MIVLHVGRSVRQRLESVLHQTNVLQPQCRIGRKG